MASSQQSAGSALDTNFGVDYVICYRLAAADKGKAEAQFEKLVRLLANVGLDLEVRDGDDCSVLIFTKIVSERHLLGEVYRSRIKDWLHGIRLTAPEKETEKLLASEPLTDSERLRIAYFLITSPESEGGAGITPQKGEWKNVESIFPLHNRSFNKEWLKRWSGKMYISAEDLTEIRDRFGEKFSLVYAIAIGLWSAAFIEYWKRQEVDLAVRWGVRGASSIQHLRPEFEYEKEVSDSVTGEKVKVFPARKRLVRQLLQVPFAILAISVLGGLIATCFAIEIFISEVYNGPLKWLLVFLPVGLLTAFIPILTTILTGIATRLTEYENYATIDSYEAAMTRKVFIFNFITCYLPLFLTAFIYIPFGSLIVPHLDIFGLTVESLMDDPKQLQMPKAGFQINSARLQKQVFYFAIQAQIVNLALEIIVPYIKRSGFNKVKKIKSSIASRRGGEIPDASMNDPPEEAAFLARVRDEARLEIYDVNVDLREMCMQFGYLVLFSVVWPLSGFTYLVNNWFELRSDAIKICSGMQRPVPWRGDSIGPWLDSLGFLAWLGSITTAALIYLFGGNGLGPEGTPWNIKVWGLLLTIFFSEHIYLLVRLGIRTILVSIESPGLQKERQERFSVRKLYLEEWLGEEEAARIAEGLVGKADRKMLGEEAGGPIGAKAEDKFWGRQQGLEETLKAGKGIISRSASREKKDQ
ncbi:hypothetical protein FGG08_002011 [Glutinoglossum americanum]|uniref:Uncharacterized protein n=1 Tax=Glutinoglossum americanum TaxID=1670608 RepID=A0A9P8I748_9PEZI|nr:hypothetical protein FGG08_002011 [Glutinoglossum americanum]